MEQIQIQGCSSRTYAERPSVSSLSVEIKWANFRKAFSQEKICVPTSCLAPFRHSLRQLVFLDSATDGADGSATAAAAAVTTYAGGGTDEGGTGAP